MYTKFIADNRIPTHTCDEILREMPKYKADLTAMCEEYGYCEVVNAIYHARNNQFACIDWQEIEEYLDEKLWYDLMPEFVVPCAEIDLVELTPEDLVNAAKETVFNSDYHTPKGNVAINMTCTNEHDHAEILRKLGECCTDLEKLSKEYDSFDAYDYILELCRERNLAVNALARSAGVPPSTVKNILNGASKNPGVVTIKMLCDGLGISVVEFFDTEEFRKLEQEIR